MRIVILGKTPRLPGLSELPLLASYGSAGIYPHRLGAAGIIDGMGSAFVSDPLGSGE